MSRVKSKEKDSKTDTDDTDTDDTDDTDTDDTDDTDETVSIKTKSEESTDGTDTDSEHKKKRNSQRGLNLDTEKSSITTTASKQIFDPLNNISQYLPIDDSFDPLNHIVTIVGLNDDILDPGRFLKTAIEHMVTFGMYNQPSFWPHRWLDPPKSQRRYVHPDILKERMPENMTPIGDVPECTWTEHARAILVNAHEKYTSNNIKDFVIAGMEDFCRQVAKDRQSKMLSECKHLPLIWSVCNIRIPNALPIQLITYMNDCNNLTVTCKSMISLIQSRYMINVATYDRNNRTITVDEPLVLQNEWALTFPLVVVDHNAGDIFFVMHNGGDVFSLYENRKSLGNEVIKAIKTTCSWWSSGANSEDGARQNQEIYGLVTSTINSHIFDQKNEIKLPLALELVCDALTRVKTDMLSAPHVRDSQKTIDFQNEIRTILTEEFDKLKTMQNIKDNYEARMWWAITRGEIGFQTSRMKQYNNRRSVLLVKRSSWDYKKRLDLCQKYTKYNWANPVEAAHLLEDFHDFDAITFSNNTIIRKTDVMNAIVHPLTEAGTSRVIGDARVNAINSLYSNDGGPRLYSQTELDYMMTNVKGKEQRNKLTNRLYHGKIAYFLLSHEVSNASTEKYGTRSHASLCKVRYNQTQNELVVHWLEGVFENVYKLCAVPILTYLSLYFNAEVQQIQYSKGDTLCVEGPHCGTIALYAANERMRNDKEQRYTSGQRSEWEAFQMPVTQALDFRTRLMYSMFLMKLSRNVQ